MAGEIARLRRAEKARDEVDRKVRLAFLAAVDAHGYAQVARVLGMSRQAVRQLAERARR